MFYSTRIENGFAYIDEEESRHLTTVLRYKAGDRLEITNGKGSFFTAELTEIGKRYAVARVMTEQKMPPALAQLHLAIAPTKNIDRFEWLLEKAVEIGIDTISPILCRHSERTVIRHDRLEKVVVSAMKQSLRAYLPTLAPLTPFREVLLKSTAPQRFIGWCPPDQEMPHVKEALQPGLDTIIFIGPEGDFSPEEIQLAQAHKCLPITLGKARLRTETAGIYACSVFNLAQEG